MANNHSDHVYAVTGDAKPKGYKLRFSTEVASPVFTGKRDGKGIKASDGSDILLELIDIETDQLVISNGPFKAKIVLLPEDFGAVWTPLQFKNRILTQWEKKKNILQGDVSVSIKHGRGTIGNIRIKHDRNHFRKAKFRLGAMIHDCSYEIKEAVSEPFEVKDCRNESSKNIRPLTLDDKVSRLKNVGRRGPCCKRLVNEKIDTVKDFLDRHSSNPVALQKIYGSSGKRWEQTVRHAKTSISDKQCNSACESVGSASHGTEIARILINRDGLTELEVGSYEPSPSSNHTTSITFNQFDPFDPFVLKNELLCEDIWSYI